MKIVQVRISELPDPSQQPDRWSHRDPAAFRAENLADLADSIHASGMLELPVIRQNAEQKWEIVAGHRRIGALHVLAARKGARPGAFATVECLDVGDTSDPTLLTWSAASNELVRKLEPRERLRFVKAASEAEMAIRDIALATGVSEKSIARDLRVALCDPVLRLVLEDRLTCTAAAELLDVAHRAKRVEDLVKFLEDRARSQPGDSRKTRKKTSKPGAIVDKDVVEALSLQLALGLQLTADRPPRPAAAEFDAATTTASIHLEVDAKHDDVETLIATVRDVGLVITKIADVAKMRKQFANGAGSENIGDAILNRLGLNDPDEDPRKRGE